MLQGQRVLGRWQVASSAGLDCQQQPAEWGGLALGRIRRSQARSSRQAAGNHGVRLQKALGWLHPSAGDMVVFEWSLCDCLVLHHKARAKAKMHQVLVTSVCDCREGQVARLALLWAYLHADEAEAAPKASFASVKQEPPQPLLPQVRTSNLEAQFNVPELTCVYHCMLTRLKPTQGQLLP